jgi:hypothetical protein
VFIVFNGTDSECVKFSRYNLEVSHRVRNRSHKNVLYTKMLRVAMICPPTNYTYKAYNIPLRICRSASNGSRYSSVGIATGYGLNDRGVGVRVPVGSRIFSPPCRPDRLWGPHSLLSNEYAWTLSPGIKRPLREADHSLPTTADVKKSCVYTFTPPYVVMA